MKRFALLLVALWATLFAPLQAFAGMPLSMQVAVQNTADAPPGYKVIYKEDFTTAGNFVRKGNGPAHEGGYPTAVGTWAMNPWYGRSLCIGQKGQGAEFMLDAQRCGDGTNGTITFDGANMVLNLRTPTGGEAAVLPTDATYGYCDFSVVGGTGGVSSQTLTIATVNSGTVCPWAGIAGTGVSGSPKIDNYGTGTGGTGTYHLNSAQTIANGTTITSTRVWPFVSTQLNSLEFLTLKPNKGFCIETRDKLPTNGGTWPVWWLWTSNGYYDVSANNYPTVAKAEIDKEHFNTAGANDLTTELHWHTVAGGTYYASGTSSKTPYAIEGSYHVNRVCADLNKVEWFLDNVKVKQASFPSNAVAWKDNFQAIIFMLSACATTASYCGVYDGTPAAYPIDYVKVMYRADGVGCTTEAAGCDYMLNTKGDGTGRGAQLINGDNNLYLQRFPWSTYDNCTAAPTTVSSPDGLTGQGINIAVNGANADCAKMFWGDTGAGLGVKSGRTYRAFAAFGYKAGAGNAGKIFIGHESTSDVAYSLSGTTPTNYFGSACASPSITAVGAHWEFVCTYTAPADGKAFMQFGPNSATNGNSVDLYQLELRETTPLSSNDLHLPEVLRPAYDYAALDLAA